MGPTGLPNFPSLRLVFFDDKELLDRITLQVRANELLDVQKETSIPGEAPHDLRAVGFIPWYPLTNPR